MFVNNEANEVHVIDLSNGRLRCLEQISCPSFNKALNFIQKFREFQIRRKHFLVVDNFKCQGYIFWGEIYIICEAQTFKRLTNITWKVGIVEYFSRIQINGMVLVFKWIYLTSPDWSSIMNISKVKSIRICICVSADLCIYHNTCQIC